MASPHGSNVQLVPHPIYADELHSAMTSPDGSNVQLEPHPIHISSRAISIQNMQVGQPYLYSESGYHGYIPPAMQLSRLTKEPRMSDALL
jgi:hypothetical protein